MHSARSRAAFHTAFCEHHCAGAARPLVTERSRLARAMLGDRCLVSGREQTQLETLARRSPPQSQPRPAFAGASGLCRGGAPMLLDPWARVPGERRCRVLRLEEAEPRQLEGSHADMCVSYKRKGWRNAGGKRNLHDSAHLTLIFSLSQPRIKARYRVPLPGRASASRGGAAGV